MEKEEEVLLVHADIADVTLADPKELDDKTGEDLPPVSAELSDIIKDMTEEELELLLAHAYALVLTPAGKEDSEDDEDDEDTNDEEEEKVTEAVDTIIVTHKDLLGNKRILTVSDKGTKLNMVNQHKIPSSISNIAFNINLGDFQKAGYANSGNADQALWVKNSTLAAWKLSKGNPTKFATEFSKLMKLNFYASDTKGEILSEALITHMTAAERNAGKMKRRTPKWRKRARIRYIRNKKCPTGTTWSSTSKSCTRLNIDLSRLQKMIAKMRIKG
jgi:hypothetical protein